jgi:glutamate/tyrosine decarboxylase-like PLP-dependent enzyme
VAEVCARRRIWMHVDGAYGLAALAAPSVRPEFDGIERADSFIVDPHKWLFAPFDACALLYRDPAKGRAAHAQHAGYLDVINATPDDWNPSDYAYHLSRRARGLPFWFSLAAHGTAAYTDAIESTLRVARVAADEIRQREYVELVREPVLSVVVFRRLGWSTEQYYDWTDRLMRANYAFVTPTSHEGETVTRFAVVNPRTSFADVRGILDTMA